MCLFFWSCVFAVCKMSGGVQKLANFCLLYALHQCLPPLLLIWLFRCNAAITALRVHCVDIYIDSCAPIYGTLVLQFRSQVLVRAINHVVCGLSVIAFVFRPAYYVDNCCSLVLAISTAIYINLCPCRKFIATWLSLFAMSDEGVNVTTHLVLVPSCASIQPKWRRRSTGLLLLLPRF